MRETFAGNLADQPSALRRLVGHRGAIVARWRAALERPLQKLYVIGSGSSLYAGEIAGAVWADLLDLDVACLPTLRFLEEVADSRLGAGTAVLAISQSGGTLNLVQGIARARRLGCLTIAVTADPASPLATAAEIVVDSTTGPEAIYAKTKGFTTSALAASLIGVAAAEGQGRTTPTTRRSLEATFDALADATATVIDRTESIGADLAQRFANVDGLAVVGARHLLPAAHEGALKVLEVAKLLVAAYELEESLHGPFNAFGPRTGLVVLGAAGGRTERFAAFCAGAVLIGAPLVTIAEAGMLEPSTAPPTGPAHAIDVELPRLPYAPLAPLLGVLPLQVLASKLSILRGVDPDATRYPQLYAVFRTKAGQGGA